MANRLKMTEQQAIVGLAAQGWAQRRIARELGVDRGTVARYVRLARNEAAAIAATADLSKPAIPITGSDGLSPSVPDSNAAIPITGSDDRPDPKPAILITGSSGQRSRCEPFRAVIVEALEKGLSAQRIWQDLRADHGFTDGYQSVQRFVRTLRSATPLPFRRMECAAGEEAQIDFGTGAPIVKPEGKRRHTHVFRVVLSHSRKGYSEAVYRQTTDEFIRCLENAFWHFGGVPKTLVIDNLKAAVTQADWFDPEINPKLRACAAHFGTVILPTRPRTPRHKGKVERGVGYVQDNGLKGKRFSSLEEQNRHLLEWERHTADTRIHGTTRWQVFKVFEEVERSALLPLPVERFPFFHEAQRSVHRDAHVEVDKAYYSVPPEYVGHRLWVRWDGRVVRVFDSRMQQVAMHAQREPGKFSTDPRHIADRKIAGVERGTAWLLRKAGRIGVHSQRWGESMVKERGIEGVRVLVGLISLAGRYPSASIEKACETALTHGAFRLRTIRALLQREGPKQEQFEYMQEHPIIRSIRDYDDLVRGAFAESPDHSHWAKEVAV